MTLAIHDDETTGAGIRRVVLRSLDEAIGRLASSETPSDETVHETRKRLKEVRALLRLRVDSLPAGGRPLRIALRDAGRFFADARDARAAINIFDKVAERLRDDWGDVPLRRLREALVQRKERVGVSPSTKVLATLRAARREVELWEDRPNGFDLIADGYETSYRRARRAMREAYAEGTPPAFHEWRKRTKDLWHQTQFTGMTRTIGPVPGHDEDTLDDLARRLGEHHDLTRLHEVCTSFPAGVVAPTLLRDIDAHVRRGYDRLERKTRRIGRRIFGEKPGTWLQRMEAHWLLKRGDRNAPWLRQKTGVGFGRWACRHY
jgi:CHAD domain